MEEGERVETKSRAVRFKTTMKENIYMGFLAGGIQYGPRFRLAEQFHANFEINPNKPDFSVFGVIDICSAAEEWERKLILKPGVLDCSLQSGSAAAQVYVPT